MKNSCDFFYLVAACLLMYSCGETVREKHYESGTLESRTFFAKDGRTIDSVVIFFENSPGGRVVKKREIFASGMKTAWMSYNSLSRLTEMVVFDEKQKQRFFIGITYSSSDSVVAKKSTTYLDNRNYRQIYSIEEFDGEGKLKLKHFRFTNLERSKTEYKINILFSDGEIAEIFLYDTPLAKKQFYKSGRLKQIAYFTDVGTLTKEVPAGTYDSLAAKCDSIDRHIQANLAKAISNTVKKP